VRTTLQLRESEITRLSGELVQKVVSFEELWNTGEEKDVTILKLQQTVETARADLETEKKQVEGKSFFSILCLPLDLFTFCFQTYGPL
jgi:hypothetical protein